MAALVRPTLSARISFLLLPIVISLWEYGFTTREHNAMLIQFAGSPVVSVSIFVLIFGSAFALLTWNKKRFLTGGIIGFLLGVALIAVSGSIGGYLNDKMTPEAAGGAAFFAAFSWSVWHILSFAKRCLAGEPVHQSDLSATEASDQPKKGRWVSGQPSLK